MKRMNILLIIILLLFINIIKAQNKEEDSLYISYSLGYTNQYITYDSSVRPTQALSIKTILKTKRGVCSSYDILFRYYVNRDTKRKYVKTYNFEGGIPTHEATIINFYGVWYFFDACWNVSWKKIVPKRMKSGYIYWTNGNEGFIKDAKEFMPVED